jgi:hypothetical protein
MLSGVVGGMFLSTMTVGAAELLTKAPMSEYKAPLGGPAVDGFNWKAEALGGSLGHEPLVGVQGAFSVPLSHSYGMQIDFKAGSLDGDAYGSIAGHLFWRDPGRGLLGAYVSHTTLDRFGGAHVTQFAAEGEYYWGRFTLQGIVGIETGNSTSVTATTAPTGNLPGTVFTEGFDVKTRFFDQINLKYYLTDNFAGYVGHRYLGGKGAAALGAEYAFPVSRQMLASAYVEGRIGEDKFDGIWGGLRIYYGQSDKTLIQRHRQDDPTIWASLMSIVNSAVSAASQFCQSGEILSDGICTGFVE